ncbi:Putative prophage CPS-53 integrase [Providencia rustigianii]|nr:Putative prophage CPS-53 integrase [Providencia rettgeri]SPY79054.1 Putative prophage CPS-53 integrase [Providencia rustigianii]VEB75722.1 Putative prophage CPS-53 integrase [Providencia rustigianii]
MHEKEFNSVWIEIQLVHIDKNVIRGAYNYAQYLEGVKMMQWYVDYMDELGEGRNLGELLTKTSYPYLW